MKFYENNSKYCEEGIRMKTNGMLIAMYAVAVLVEIGLPVTLAIWMVRKGKIGWAVILTGVLTFIGSQVVHIPLLQIPALLQKLGLPISAPTSWPTWAYALFLGLMAGFCEETARLVGFKVLKSKASSYKSGLALGIGHGGVESVIVGFTVLGSLIAALVYTANPSLMGAASPDQANMALAQLQGVLSNPWHLPLAGAVERLTAVSCHLFMSVLVWQTVSRGKVWGYWAAVLYHALLDGASVMLMTTGLSAWGLEACLLPFMAFSLVMIWVFWKKEKASMPELPTADAGSVEAPAA
jgi:uncharacterized membrane protein YhfC